MKILYIHNNYASNNSGEEHAAEGIVNLLKQNGHEVEWYKRKSVELDASFRKKSLAIFMGAWNPKAVKQVKQKIQVFQPDVVQIQNLYPLISAAILKPIKKAGIPIVMRCPNYRLFCPNGLHLDNKGKVCEKCLDTGRELHCILKKCESTWIRSIGYAFRNFVARKLWKIMENVDTYIVQSEFQKQKFIANGIPENKLAIVPGLTPMIKTAEKQKVGDLVSFVGRVSLEKGIKEFIEAAKQLPHIKFAIAGTVDKSLSYLQIDSPENILWTGFLSGDRLDNFYADSRIIVVPGKWYEGFPNVITRAMQHGKPVITSKLGAMASIIDHKKNGLLVEPGNANELTKAIERLYNHTDLCELYGKNGSLKAAKNYAPNKIYQDLSTIYRAVVKK